MIKETVNSLLDWFGWQHARDILAPTIAGAVYGIRNKTIDWKKECTLCADRLVC